MASPAILAANVSAPGTGGPVNGLAIAQTNNKVNLAKAKIAEFTNLFQALPRLLDKYTSMADNIFAKITLIKSNIQIIVDEINKLKAFIIYLEMDFESKCNEFQLAENPPVLDPPNTGVNIDQSLTLDDIIAQAEELYGNLLENLIAQGQNRAIRRVYALGAQLQRIKNTRVEQINI